jgi:hypothetical protein
MWKSYTSTQLYKNPFKTIKSVEKQILYLLFISFHFVSARFPYFEKNKRRFMISPWCLCACVLPPFRLKAGIVEPEENCLPVCRRISPLLLLGNGSVNVTAETNTHATKNCLTRCFLFGPFRIRYSICRERKVGYYLFAYVWELVFQVGLSYIIKQHPNL